MSESVGRARVVLDVARAAGPWVALAVLFAAPGCCILPLPIFLMFAGGACERAMGVTRARASRSGLGLLVAPLFYVPLLSFFVAESFVVRDGPGTAGWAQALAAVVVSCVLTTLLFPLYGAPLEIIARGGAPFESVLSSGARAARHGVGSTLAHAVAVGTIGASPWLLVIATRALLRDTPLVLALLLYVAATLAVTLNLGLVAHFWSGGTERFGAARSTTPLARSRGEDGVSVLGRLAGSLILGFAPAVVLAVVLTIALLSPTPAWRVETSTELSEAALSFADHGTDEAIVLDQRSGLSVSSPADDTWRVETADGGGAGDVRILHGDEASAYVRRGHYGARPIWNLCARALRETRCFSFDEHGVRLDDSPLDRIRERLGTIGAGLLALYLVALALLILAQTRRAGIASQLDRPRFDGARETAAFVGTLRTEAPLPVTQSVVTIRGRATLELGEHGTVRLPEGKLTLLVPPASTHLVDGAELTMIATLRASGSPFRDGASPLPPDAQLVVGSLARARESYADHVARVNVFAALPMLFLALGLCCAVLVNL